MADMLDYIEWRGDLTFREREFNDVDNLILSLLAYSDFKGIISMDEGSPPISIAELYSKYTEAGKNQSELACNPKPVFEKCAKTNRFGNIMVKDYVDIVNQGRQFQFAAMTFQLGDGTVYAAFRGTDNTLVGWREDLNFSFMEATPAQLCAAEYLDIVCEKTNDPVRTGGHSKGGNLAMYAAAFCEDQNKDRIVRVYSNDGPGFNEIIAENENYKNILDRVSLAIPEGSPIGILLFNKQDKKVVESTGKNGAAQHNPYTWCINKWGLVQAEKQSSMSIFLDKTLDEWLSRLTREQKQEFVDTVFDTLEATGARSFSELYSNKRESLSAIIKAARRLHADQVSTVISVIKTFLDAGKDVWLGDQKPKLDKSKEDKLAMDELND